MCEARESKDVCELQSKKGELLQEKLSLLRDYGVSLTISREQLEWEIQSLEAKKRKMEADALASAEKVVDENIYEEDDWEDGDLPTGWDSLPWSEGVNMYVPIDMSACVYKYVCVCVCVCVCVVWTLNRSQQCTHSQGTKRRSSGQKGGKLGHQLQSLKMAHRAPAGYQSPHLSETPHPWKFRSLDVENGAMKCRTLP